MPKVVTLVGISRYRRYIFAKAKLSILFTDFGSVMLSAGQKFAIVMMVDTPGTKLPIVVEYAADERTAGADITDGEGYISQYGRVWNRAEEKDCNVCLKVFTKDR